MEKIRGIVFDLYGTLYDVHSVAGPCDAYHPGRGREISIIWRQKQLEYTWLRSLMGQYVDFEQATRDALIFASNYLKLPLDEAARSALCDAYLHIKAYPEVPDALGLLNQLQIPLAILSNGSANSIRSVVAASGLDHLFTHLISADSAQIFKPHHRVYALAEERLQQDRSAILFVSSNAWDASGARHFGYPVCWINRAGNTFDELGQTPDHTVGGLDELATWIAAGNSGT
jgi:2-haloacid dehalogenase